MKTIPVLALLACTFLHAQDVPHVKHVHRFNDKFNVALFSADLLVRTLDTQSTRSFLTNPCHCIVEANLPPAIVSSTPRMLAYSLSIAVALHGAAYIAHRTGHHKIERLIPMFDIATTGKDVAHNYYLIAGAR